MIFRRQGSSLVQSNNQQNYMACQVETGDVDTNSPGSAFAKASGRQSSLSTTLRRIGGEGS